MQADDEASDAGGGDAGDALSESSDSGGDGDFVTVPSVRSGDKRLPQPRGTTLRAKRAKGGGTGGRGRGRGGQRSTPRGTARFQGDFVPPGDYQPQPMPFIGDPGIRVSDFSFAKVDFLQFVF